MDNYEQSSQYGQMDFSLPHDVVPLPSGGKFYKSKKKSVKVGYLTASDENLLSGLINNPNRDNLITGIVRMKLYEPDLKVDELLFGDMEAILIFLRNTSFGSEYVINVTDPQTNKKFQATIDLSEINIKKTTSEPDENGLFTTKLPKSGRVVKLRLLNVGDEGEINKIIESYPTMNPPRVTLRLNKQIVSVDGNDNREEIAKFIESMPIMDSKHIKKFMNENEPGLDLNKLVMAPSGEKVEVVINFGVEFFRPFF